MDPDASIRSRPQQPPKRRVLPLLLLGAAFLSLFMMVLTTVPATPAVAGDTLQQEPDRPLACPTSVSGTYDDTIERDDFCVYYDADDDDTPQELAEEVADYTDDHWDRFVDFGFNEPATPGELQVQLRDGTGCNGATGASLDYMYVFEDCDPPQEQMEHVTGHELFHRVQYAHDANSKWMREGTARAMQDQVYAHIDDFADALTLPSSFNSEVNNYLASPNNDLTNNPGYLSALWWKFYMEQFGSITTEPQVGVDAMVQLWQAAESADDIAAINRALTIMETGVDFNDAFKQFVVANWTKDLSGVPDGSYNYIDEDTPGNPGPYGPIDPVDGGAVNLSSGATWNNQFVDRYAARYYEASPGSNCPVITASFNRDSGSSSFYHVITDDSGAFLSHGVGAGDDWAQSFLTGDLTRIVAIAGSLDGTNSVDVEFSCADPVLDVVMPNSGAAARVGPHDAPGKFLVQLFVTNGAADAPVVAGLDYTDFTVQVNGENALVTAGGFIQEQYWLQVQAPPQDADDVYDLEVSLVDGATTLATDTNANSVLYDDDNVDHVLVVDRSESMAWPSDPIVEHKLPAAQDAAYFYVDVTRNGDGLAVVPYHHDQDPAPFDMDTVALPVRTDAKEYVDDLTADGATSIGDGLSEAVGQAAASPTDNPHCSFILLSDGMENSSLYWSDVETDVKDSGCPVTTIAFGPDSNETLMQEIATETGGLYLYNDVYVSQPNVASNSPGATTAESRDEMHLDLTSNYEYALTDQAGRERLFQHRDIINSPVGTVSNTHSLVLEGNETDVIFALDYSSTSFADLHLKLRRPDGTIIENTRLDPYDFEDSSSNHRGWIVDAPMPGEWDLIVETDYTSGIDVPYQVLVSGRTPLSVELLPPYLLDFFPTTGNRVPICAIFSGDAPVSSGQLEAIVTAPDGTETLLPLYDDGQNGDGNAGDGLFCGLYSLLNQAPESQPPQEDDADDQPQALPEGGYHIRLVGSTGFDGPGREAMGSFAITGSPDDDGDGMPDGYEEEYGIDDPNADPDLDSQSSSLPFTNLDEYFYGTDPTNSDTDGGGESDSSEIENGRDPLSPDDDVIEAPDFFHVRPGNGGVGLEYDVKQDYALMRLFRAPSVDGPWSFHELNLPPTGQYTDTQVTNGETYFYRLEAHDEDGNRSAIIGASDPNMGATPSVDPHPPLAYVLINGDDTKTAFRDVMLTFVPPMEEAALFEDITEMMLSNDPHFEDAEWQTFQEEWPWTLAPTEPGTFAKVYARFRDDAGNVSTTVVGSIRYEPYTLNLPIFVR
ncbi:MAG: VWA domain-containing protein [Chloroflexota bacterium]